MSWAKARAMRKRRLASLFLVLAGAFAVTACLSLRSPVSAYTASPQSADEGFTNPVPRPDQSPGSTAKLMWDFFFNKPKNTVPAEPVPVHALARAQLDAAPDRSLYRLGHSTVLLKLRGGWWLTDPVFSERASPVQWAGPKRFHAPPIALADLPPIRGVILSHDHYDHLDHASIMQLAKTAQVFLTPLGVGDRLVDWGVPADKVRQFDWWQGTDIDGLRIVATPSQHFSGRTPFDSNRTLWASWVIVDASPDKGDLRLFFSGDTGYFDGFRKIGERYGPFDVTLLETGAYDARWPYVHMQPEQTVQAHQDLRGRWLVPVHNGTFDLAMHAWYDPFERVDALAQARGIALATPEMGQRLDLNAPQATPRWWRGGEGAETSSAIETATAAR